MEPVTIGPETFAPIKRICACGAHRVDRGDTIEEGWLHGLFHCFPLERLKQADIFDAA